jgi:flagellar M-ring protein FliF
MKKIFANLPVKQRIMIAIMIVAVGGGLYSLVHWKREANYHPIFTGLAAEEAAGIVQKLKETGADYRLADGGKTVLAPSERIPELRLTLAAAGYPKSGRIGFELFDKVNLGTTEFAEHVNYRRALEGELERSVMSLEEVEQARVHLTFPKESVFLDEQKPAKASVLVRLKPGAQLKPQNVLAIDHLVASAVEGLAPDAVSVLDMNGNLLGRPKAQGGQDAVELSEESINFRRKLESDLMAKINATLEPLLGAEKFKAGVSLDCDFSAGEQSEELFDPARTVMLTSQRSEDNSAPSSAAGSPGSSSNLPRPTSRPGGSSSRVSRVTENITYQPSRTVKKTRLPSGGIRKMSLAVLVDQGVTWERDGNQYKRVLVPPPPEKLKVIRDMVAGVTGFNADRGDQLTVETLPFETTMLTEPPKNPAAPGVQGPSGSTQTSPVAPGQFALPAFLMDRKTQRTGGAALLLLLLAAGLFLFLKRAGQKRGARVALDAPAALQAGDGATASIEEPSPEQQLEARLAERDAAQRRLEAQALGSLKIAPVVTKASEVLAKHLREKITQDTQLAAQILQSWIRDEEEI